MQSIGILWTEMLTLYYGSIITWFGVWLEQNTDPSE